ncbi:MAG: choice-of-anchor D domain-containing protein [Dechloromonas sp.]|uniref:Choice-of-anchor D domain-containing protein n=1 Tax=Candidatus Dechloromonas phosphorivorans TaxID=2899244 RepID=A0A9D7QH89_9RHOO|nr:choice-of-anchor D domain-containing protein [Candidatus Dechloromonas phosphorivorans]
MCLARQQGKLIIGATGSLGLGTQNLTITNDYTNVQAGSGNSFNRRAGVTGTGQILAGGNAAQAITGTGVTGGNTPNATLTIGNMRVGANTFNYQLANTGTTGPTLRGAIQTNVNGGNITDARLSGTGVTASNYNAGGPNGNSGNLGVTFTAASAGAQAALSGQAINLRSNFDNIADQKLNIVLAGGAAAYNAAAGSATPSPATVANQRVGGTNVAALTISNTAAAGIFSEDLRATFGSNGGAALNNGGSVVSLIAGGNNVSAMTARVDTSTAGAKTGSVTLNYETLGTVNGVSNGLGTASAGSQTINVSGNVYRLAQGDTTPLAANFGNRHVGDSVSQTLTIKNLSVNDGFSEKLNASFGTNSGNATNNGGSVNLLAAGGSNAASMSVGMDTSSVGNKSGSVAVNYQSDGAGTSGLSSISAGSQTVNVSGSVYRLAQANTLGAVSFGNVHVGDSVQQALSISNTAANDGFSEKLNASFGNATDARITNNGGSISQLAAGATNSSMVVGLNTAAAGTVNGSIAVNFASDGAGTSGLGISALATQNVGVSGNITTQGNVYRLASASPATPNPVNFGNVRINTATDQALTIGNTAANDGFSEKLNASISSNGAPVTASGSFNLLGPQASDNSSLHVGIDTSSAGAKSGSATIALVSDGAGTSGLGQTSLASQTVNVNGAVYRLANPQSVTSSLTLAARVGGSASGNVSITNQSPDIYTEALKVVAGAAPSSLFNIGSNPANIAAQGTGTLQVSLNTATAGSSTGTLTLNNTSTGAGTTNAADVSVGTSNVTLTGKVYTAAQATVQPAVNFGIVHVNEVVAVRGVSVQNSAPVTALNDTLAASIGGATGSFSSNNGSVAGLAAGGPANTTALTVGVNTATAGIFNGTANLALASQNPDMADLGLGSRSVALSAQVNKYANAEFGKVTGAGALTRNGSVFTLNFGTWVQGSGLLSAILDVDNLVNGGPADDLNGSLNIVDGNDFFASLLLASFSNVGADASSGDALSFLFDTNALALGSYQDSVALTWFGTNGSGYRDANDHFYTLQVIGTIVQQGANVPEPNSLLLLTVALLAGLGVSRRRHSV